MAITAAMVKELRTKTGAGMMDCKKALTESNGDMEKAVDLLREHGLAAAAKKADRIAAEGLVYSYIHGNGRIGVLVEVNCETDFVAQTDNFKALCKDIAMQIAAANPSYLNREAVPAEAIENEKKIIIAQMANDPKAANKPDAIKEKMATGRLGKFYKENCLVDQAFIKDGNMDVNAYVNATAKKLGGDIKIVEYTHFIKGEGLEKRVDDFAAEVAAAVKG